MAQRLPRFPLHCAKSPIIAVFSVLAVSLAGTLLFISNLHYIRLGVVLQRWREPSNISDTIYTKSPSKLEVYFPLVPGKDHREWNARKMRDLHACLIQDNCGKNQRKVALLAAHWFQEAVVGTFRGGEGIWALSMYHSLQALGYTTLFSIDFEEALSQYRMMPDLVKVVVRNRAGECHGNPQCVKGPSNPTGIPAWKIFDFEFFPSYATHYQASLMNGKWILSANPDHRVANQSESPIQYIGYSIERECSKIPVVPLSERKDRVWMLMKQLVYVYNNHFAWNRSYFPLSARELDLDFVGAWDLDQHYAWDPDTQGTMEDIADPEQRVINLGRLSQGDFYREIGHTKVIIGMGDPWWSPSPYNALCLGIPFLNPILKWQENDPWNRRHWYSQHPSLVPYDPPYVYNVHAHNFTAFVDAIRAASSTEIRRFIPTYMTESAVQERIVQLMETDWKVQAAALLEERRAEPGSYIFEL